MAQKVHSPTAGALSQLLRVRSGADELVAVRCAVFVSIWGVACSAKRTANKELMVMLKLKCDALRYQANPRGPQHIKQ